jgi:small-conductance mechanosensitive channel
MIASTVLNRAEETFGAFLPRLGAAAALIVFGYLIAWLAARIISKTLNTLGFDGLAERIGVSRELSRIGLPSASRAVAAAVRVAIVIVATIAAVSSLGLSALTASLNATILFLPKLLAAGLLLLAGLVLARIVRERIDRASSRMDLAGPLGMLAEMAIIAIFVATALAQLTVPLAILTLIVAILIAAVAFSAALAFGLGSRDTARQIAAGRSLAGSLRVGEKITMGELTGEIETIGSAATLLRTATSTLRIPNHMLLESVVEVHDEPPASSDPEVPDQG